MIYFSDQVESTSVAHGGEILGTHSTSNPYKYWSSTSIIYLWTDDYANTVNANTSVMNDGRHQLFCVRCVRSF